MTNLKMGPREWIMLIVLSILWGGSFVFNEVIIETLPTFTTVLGRVSLAALTLYIIIRVSGNKIPTDRRTWGMFCVMGLVNNFIPFSLIVWGQTQITGGLASILNGMTPIFTVLLAHFFTDDERFSAAKGIGVTLGFVGVTILIGADALQSIGLHFWAQIAILGAALSYGFAAIWGRQFRHLPPMITAFGSLTTATAMILPVAVILEEPWNSSPTLITWTALIGLATLSTAIAYLLYFGLINRAGATNAALVTFLIPLSAILLGAVLLGERLHWTDVMGMLLIFAGLGFVTGRMGAGR